MNFRVTTVTLGFGFLSGSAIAQSVDITGYRPLPGLVAVSHGGSIAVTWDGENGQELLARFSIAGGIPTVSEHQCANKGWWMDRFGAGPGAGVRCEDRRPTHRPRVVSASTPRPAPCWRFTRFPERAGITPTMLTIETPRPPRGRGSARWGELVGLNGRTPPGIWPPPSGSAITRSIRQPRGAGSRRPSLGSNPKHRLIGSGAPTRVMRLIAVHRSTWLRQPLATRVWRRPRGMLTHAPEGHRGTFSTWPRGHESTLPALSAPERFLRH